MFICLMSAVALNVIADRSRPGRDAEAGLAESAKEDRPVSLVAAGVHRVQAGDRLAIVPADDAGAAGGAEQRPADGVDARRHDVEPPIGGLLFVPGPIFAILVVHACDSASG